MNDSDKTGDFLPHGEESPAAALPRHIGRYRVDKLFGKEKAAEKLAKSNRAC